MANNARDGDSWAINKGPKTGVAQSHSCGSMVHCVRYPHTPIGVALVLSVARRPRLSNSPGSASSLVRSPDP
eukprot:3784838-Ditylum_brightwellii.AAC.1